MTLFNSTKNKMIANHLKTAVTFWSRLKGLLGTDGLSDTEALFIENCSGIHTCFMKYAIDVVFIDSSLKVESVHSQVKPWKFVWSGPQGKSVIELQSGRAVAIQLEIGDQLHVAH